MAVGAVTAFIWAVKDRQLDDLDTPPRRILGDNDDDRADDDSP